MLVIIPTYKRIDRLRWTLLSLMQADVPDCSERLLICLANNHPPTKVQVHKLVNEIKSQSENTHWEWYLLDREKTLAPVDNWYSAITTMANEDEVVFLHGDDDLFLPWGIIERYRAAYEYNVDVLLSKSASGLVFIDDKSVYYPEELSVSKKTLHSESIGWGEIAGWGPAFIGNHCYRYTERFRQALNLSFEWCHQQDWLDWNTRTLMLPYYLPFAVKQLDGELYGFGQSCVIRGRGLIETSQAPFGVPGWNSGFLVLCSYGLLTSPDFISRPELDAARHGLAKMASEWYLTFFFDKRITPQMRRETLQRIPLPTSLLLANLWHGLRRVLLDKLGLTALQLQKEAPKHAIPASEFLKRLKEAS